jgi:hypothetical protein
VEEKRQIGIQRCPGKFVGGEDISDEVNAHRRAVLLSDRKMIDPVVDELRLGLACHRLEG